jgi:molecular chaperone GrpE (heat shock protein)
MPDDTTAPRLGKAPFLVADLTLWAAAVAIVLFSPRPLGAWAAAAVCACAAFGAWLMVLPFLTEHEAALAREQRGDLAGTLAQIQKLEAAALQIGQATASWQGVADKAGRSVESAAAIEARLSQEARAFGEILARQNDAEKQTLRLEVEKLRRAEGDWLQTVVRMLDHAYLLFRAAVQSRQENVARQVGQFQLALRDLARRVGLVPVLAQPGEPFDERRHQLPEGAARPAGQAFVADTLMTGYAYQGQPLRPVLVALQETVGAAATDTTVIRATAEAAEPQGEPPDEAPPAAQPDDQQRALL